MPLAPIPIILMEVDMEDMVPIRGVVFSQRMGIQIGDMEQKQYSILEVPKRVLRIWLYGISFVLVCKRFMI